MGLWNKVLGVGFVDEFKEGKPMVIAHVKGEFAMRKCVKIANHYGYELTNMSQSSLALGLARYPTYTLIFKKR